MWPQTGTNEAIGDRKPTLTQRSSTVACFTRSFSPGSVLTQQRSSALSCRTKQRHSQKKSWSVIELSRKHQRAVPHHANVDFLLGTVRKDLRCICRRRFKFVMEVIGRDSIERQIKQALWLFPSRLWLILPGPHSDNGCCKRTVSCRTFRYTPR